MSVPFCPSLCQHPLRPSSCSPLLTTARARAMVAATPSGLCSALSGPATSVWPWARTRLRQAEAGCPPRLLQICQACGSTPHFQGQKRAWIFLRSGRDKIEDANTEHGGSLHAGSLKTRLPSNQWEALRSRTRSQKSLRLI